jgi:hypothetical protein
VIQFVVTVGMNCARHARARVRHLWTHPNPSEAAIGAVTAAIIGIPLVIGGRVLPPTAGLLVGGVVFGIVFALVIITAVTVLHVPQARGVRIVAVAAFAFPVFAVVSSAGFPGYIRTLSRAMVLGTGALVAAALMSGLAIGALRFGLWCFDLHRRRRGRPSLEDTSVAWLLKQTPKTRIAVFVLLASAVWRSLSWTLLVGDAVAGPMTAVEAIVGGIVPFFDRLAETMLGGAILYMLFEHVDTGQDRRGTHGTGHSEDSSVEADVKMHLASDDATSAGHPGGSRS